MTTGKVSFSNLILIATAPQSKKPEEILLVLEFTAFLATWSTTNLRNLVSIETATSIHLLRRPTESQVETDWAALEEMTAEHPEARWVLSAISAGSDLEVTPRSAEVADTQLPREVRVLDKKDLLLLFQTTTSPRMTAS